MAILDENQQPRVVIVPASAMLTIMSGDVDGVGLLEVLAPEEESINNEQNGAWDHDYD